MQNPSPHIDVDEIKKAIISGIENKTKLVLQKEDINLSLNSYNDRISGDIYIFDEYYDKFWVQVPEDQIADEIIRFFILTLSEHGDLREVLISGRRNYLESRLSDTTDKILQLIQSRKAVHNQLGEITIMVDEQYPYTEFYDNNFPVWQYEIRDTNQLLHIVQRLNYDLADFAKEQIIKRVEAALSQIQHLKKG